MAQLPPAVSELVNKLMPDPIPLSPNAASFAKYGDYQVSMFTGTPDISIPLYEIKSGGITVPISLSYHASGNRYSDQAGWTGLGWTLQTGGQITRQVMGRADELYYYSNPFTPMSTCLDYWFVKDVADGVRDLTPDLFSYSFPGKSGKFMIGQSTAPAPHEKSMIPFSPIQITEGTGLLSFDIKDERGVQYKFGVNRAGVPSRETTYTSSGSGPQPSAITSWYLTEINDPNSNDQVIFEYQSVGQFLTNDISHNITVSDACQIIAATGTPGECPINETISPLQESFNSVSVLQLGIKFIYFEGGKVEFVLGGSRMDQSNLKALDEIIVYSQKIPEGAYEITKRIKFIYNSYFKNLDQTKDLRLKLDEVHISGAAGGPVEKYKFDYHTNSFSWDKDLYSYKRDLWDFYNGANNLNLIPRMDIYIQERMDVPPVLTPIGGAIDRSPNPTYLKEGVLRTIYYPTGGYTKFDYEPHKYFENSAIKLAGGLRVTTIESNDGSEANSIFKTYKYGTGESGYGEKMFDTNDYWFMNQQQYRVYQDFGGLVTSTSAHRVRMFFSQPGFHLNLSEGSPVVYPVVTEYYGNTTTNIGKVVYEFDNGAFVPDVIQLVEGTTNHYVSSQSWARGKLTKKTTFSNSGSLLQTNEISYTRFKEESKLVGYGASRLLIYPSLGAMQPYVNPCQTSAGETIDGSEYGTAPFVERTGIVLETSNKETVYVNGDISKYTSKTVTKSYDNTYLLLTDVVSSASIDTEEIVSKTKYPFSYTYSGTLTGTPKALNTLLSQNAIATPIEEYTLRRNKNGTNSRVVAGKVNTFIENQDNLAQIKMDEIFLLEANDPLTDYSPTALTSSSLTKDGRYKSRIKFNTYDWFGNLQQATKTGDAPLTILWGYNHALPIAKVQKASLSLGLINQTTTFGTGITVGTGSICTTLSGSFTISDQQIVTFNPSVFFDAGLGLWISLTMKNSSGVVVFGPKQYNESNVYTESVTLPAGTYMFCYVSPDYPDPYSASISFTVNYYTGKRQTVFHTSFEVDGVSDPVAKTGGKVWNGTYSVVMPHVLGNYVLSYFTRQNTSGASWVYQESAISITNANTSNLAIGAAGYSIDEVRLYPEGAMMTTYTYDPLIGVTSITDVNNLSTYYVYDNFGRLMHVKDHNGNIVKAYEYRYKTP